MRRREFLALTSSAAAAWPLAARAQPRERVRRVGVLTNLAADDPETPVRLAAFLQGMRELGWTVGRNIRIDQRGSGTAAAERFRQYAAELAALAPDVVLAHGTAAVAPVQQANRDVPIVFVSVSDPVGAGYVASLARPGGNITGFMLYEYGISAKWLELLKQMVPGVTRAAILRDPTQPVGIGMLGALQSVAPSFGVELSPVDARDPAEMERAIAAFARGSNGGLIVLAQTSTSVHREMITAAAARHRLPAVYPYRLFISSGGLISYGPDQTDQYRLAAGYVDRILKGEKPADLPVQAPTKYELVINLKTAKALGIEVPATVRARADEVIE